jgi:nucleoside-diphosphate-sugar epimerase
VSRILITGGAGYLGSVATEYLLGKGHQVTVLDNLLYRQNSLLHLAYQKDFDFINGDARDRELLSKLVGKYDFIIPLAAIVGAPASDRNPELATSTNYGAIVTLLSLVSSRQRIVFPTTNSGYGIKGGGEVCTEESPLTPISLYGRTKVDAEKVLMSSKNAISLRLATVFGVSPRMRLDLLVNAFTYRAARDGFLVLFEKHFKRNYIHIRDVARCFDFCIQNFDRMGDQVYNVGLSDANLSKEELALRIKKFVPDLRIISSEVGKDPDQRNYVVSNAKIEKAGFGCAFSLDDGIQELIKGYKILQDLPYANV